jgi:large subunit ribosomal protein L15
MGGHTSGRGQKGQTSRSGYHKKRGFEGGQSTLSKKLPVIKSIKSMGKKKTISIRISKFLSKDVFNISFALLSEMAGTDNVKLVGDTNYNGFDLKKVEVASDVRITSSLKAKILSEGGKVQE